MKRLSHIPSLLVLLFFFVSLSRQNTVKSADVVQSIYVSLYGHGNYKSIQEAIDSVPYGNNQWIRIHVEQGVYKEKVVIPKYKDFILLEGQGSSQTSIEWGDYTNDGNKDTTESSATFACYASNFMARDISFKNTYDGGSQTAQAVAALVFGDKSSFYRCGFYSIQDTLCDMWGRHYYENCFIEGSLDFIFGQGQSIFQGCTISIRDGAIQGTGYVTAHGRENSSDWTGFVFKSCTITGSSWTYLGRAWRPYARVIFYDTYMPNIIVPQGWDAWNANHDVWDITFVESSNKGPGSNTARRVQWMKYLSDKDLQNFLSLAYIDSDGWMEAQPR